MKTRDLSRVFVAVASDTILHIGWMCCIKRNASRLGS
jgi:hypothetical protein